MNRTLLLVGLGNPGREYENTRHNAGFAMVDSIAKRYDKISFTTKFLAHFQKVIIEEINVLLLKPQTYMNLSGKSVLEAMMFYKLKPEQIWVLHDDLDIEIGRLKVKSGGGSAGHNGLKSIDGVIGPNYHRLRIGIRGAETIYNVSDYVLQKFTNLEMEKICEIIDNAAQNISLLLNTQPDKFLNKISLMNQVGK